MFQIKTPILFLILCLCLSKNTLGATYYVATTGKINNPGTLDKPCLTIQCAVDKAKIPGDIISIRQGSYKGSVTLKYPGAPGKPITLQSYPGERATIDQGPDLIATKASYNRLNIKHHLGFLNPIGWLVIENIDIVRGYDGINMNNGHDIIIRNCRIKDSLNQGILGNGLRITIDKNLIATNGYMLNNPERVNTALTHGIYLAGVEIKITNNIIHSNKGYGIQMAGSFYPQWHTSPEYAYAKKWLIANNTLAYQRNRGGIAVWRGGATKTSIVNNLFYNNATHINAASGVEFLNSGAENLVRNNLFYSSLGRKAISDNKGGLSYTASSNLLQVNPMLRSPSSLVFFLLPRSPAINQGSELYLLGRH